MSATHERDPAEASGPSPKRPRATDDLLHPPPPSATSSGPPRHRPCVSVLMPCRNAMPWLPDAVASVLAQTGLESNGGLELIAVDDGSTDGSREWLEACAAALDGPAEHHDDDAPREEGSREREEDGGADVGEQAVGGGGGGGCGFGADRLGWEAEGFEALTVAETVRRRRAGNVLVVCSVDAFGPSGQGRALNLAYGRARGALIGEMESDDLRPPRAFAVLRDALRANPEWDCAASEVRLVGWDRPGMTRWIDWQNTVHTPREMAKARFLEIPALRASALYRREALDRVAAFDADGGTLGTLATGSDLHASATRHPYRDLWLVDGRVADCAHPSDPTYDAEGPRSNRRPPGWWPVDADFWQRWFAAGLTAGKVPEALYLWRQYPAQSTRTHDRCSLERLRACKVHFLLAPGGPARGRPVQVWGTGETLKAWTQDLRRALVEWDGYGFTEAVPSAAAAASSGAAALSASLRGRAAEAAVTAMEYRPGAPVGKQQLRGVDAAGVEAMRAAGVRFPEAPEGGVPSPVRLFAFGMEKARRKVVKTFRDFDAEGDDHWFVA